jgi:hypothetical protein
MTIFRNVEHPARPILLDPGLRHSIVTLVSDPSKINAKQIILKKVLQYKDVKQCHNLSEL